MTTTVTYLWMTAKGEIAAALHQLVAIIIIVFQPTPPTSKWQTDRWAPKRTKIVEIILDRDNSLHEYPKKWK